MRDDSKKKPLEDLWKQYLESRQNSDRDALIVQYLYLVKWVARRIFSSLPGHVKLDDLYSSGITGLVRAVEKFDPEKNNKFETYARLLIRGAIIDELRALDWIPRSIHQKAHKVSLAQQVLQERFGRNPTERELSNYLGMSVENLVTLLERIRPAILIPLNAELYDEENTTLSEKIADIKALSSGEVAERKEVQSILEKEISALPEQEKKVLLLYYYEELMLKEIGEVLGVSESRVSQIHTKAILKLRGKLHTILKSPA